jgi:AraC-like DNA-binding protein
VRAAERRGVAPRLLLAGTGIELEELDDLTGRIPVEPMQALFERARRLTSEPALGVCVGLESPPSLYGFLGFGILSAPSLRCALALLVEFQRLLGSVLTFRFETRGEAAALVVEERVDLGGARDFVLSAAMAGIYRFAIALTEDNPAARVCSALEEPCCPRSPSEWPAMFFDHERAQVTFDRGELDVRFPMGDWASFELARQECRRSLGALAADDSIDRLEHALAARTDLRTLNDAATAICVPLRRLKRELKERRIHFPVLLDRSIARHAVGLVQSTSISIHEVAVGLRYTHDTSFSRAFRRWTGSSPAAYRKLSARAALPDASHRKLLVGQPPGTIEATAERPR